MDEFRKKQTFTPEETERMENVLKELTTPIAENKYPPDIHVFSTESPFAPSDFPQEKIPLSLGYLKSLKDEPGVKDAIYNPADPESVEWHKNKKEIDKKNGEIVRVAKAIIQHSVISYTENTDTPYITNALTVADAALKAYWDYNVSPSESTPQASMIRAIETYEKIKPKVLLENCVDALCASMIAAENGDIHEYTKAVLDAAGVQYE